ncbi:MAG: hypothetical protein FJW40_06480 [Acidobacteria bacterium]|nr:hypothetical protein [Acidobacteriota bacterium]
MRCLTTAGLMLAAVLNAAEPGDRQAILRQVDSILKELTAITGWEARRPVPASFLSKRDLERNLNERIRREVKPAEIRAEETALKMLGFVPQDFDLKATMVSLLSEQAAAFYDLRERRMYLIEETSDAQQEQNLIHELAHALADQHFRLGRYMKQGRTSDDAALARTSVMEGQASWLAAEVVARRNGGSLKETPDLLRRLGSGDIDENAFPVLGKAPRYLRESFLFPYTDGFRFQHEVFLKRGTAAFAALYSQPPPSSRAILHPEAYLAGEPVDDPALPPFKLRRRYRVLTEGNLGEIDHRVWFRDYRIPEGDDLAAELRGGAYKVWELKKGRGFALQYASTWSTEEAAAHAFAAYQVVLRGKRPDFRIAQRGAAEVRGPGFHLERRGRLLYSLEGVIE